MARRRSGRRANGRARDTKLRLRCAAAAHASITAEFFFPILRDGGGGDDVHHEDDDIAHSRSLFLPVISCVRARVL